MKKQLLSILILATLLQAGCATSTTPGYSGANCWGEDDPLRCRAPVPDGCEELAANMFWCGKNPLAELGK